MSKLGSTIIARGATLSRVGSLLTRAVTIPLALAGGAAVKLALDYDEAFGKIQAVTDASAKTIGKWREQVLKLSGETARSPTELANALYFLASAGLKTDQVMQVLRASAKAAAAGLGDTTDI